MSSTGAPPSYTASSSSPDVNYSRSHHGYFRASSLSVSQSPDPSHQEKTRVSKRSSPSPLCPPRMPAAHITDADTPYAPSRTPCSLSRPEDKDIDAHRLIIKYLLLTPWMKLLSRFQNSINHHDGSIATAWSPKEMQSPHIIIVIVILTLPHRPP